MFLLIFTTSFNSHRRKME